MKSRTDQANAKNRKVNGKRAGRPAGKPRSTMDFPVVNPDAAGVDVGSERIFVAVPPDRYPDEVRIFLTFTQDLREAAQWMVQLGIKSVAMESTGVYWIPFFQILEDHGIGVFLVNARHVKNVPAAFKTDHRDSRWLRNLHAVGLLSTSFRPEQAVCTVRSIARHRDSLTRAASRQVLHMQKALTQMNILVHEVLSDITGVSGLAILDAILAGQRDPNYLVTLCDKRIRASREDLKKALVGDWREEHLFTLRQSLASWRHFRQQIEDCDAEISRLLAAFDPQDDAGKPEPPAAPEPSGTGRMRSLSAAAKERRRRDQLKAIYGVDLTEIPGVGIGVAEMVLTEVGRDFSHFPSAAHFASWLGLAPNNHESGGKVLSRKTRRLKNRLATQLRVAANSLTHSHASYLGAHLRKMKARLGAGQGITATAHKLARILYAVVTTRTPYDESAFADQEARYHQQRLNALKRAAAQYGYDFVPRPGVS